MKLTDYQYDLCVRFSRESAKTQQAIEFGAETIPRDVREISRDNLIGKMAEAAVASMLHDDFGLHVPVNYEVYPRGDYDNNDFEINGWTIDVKATRSGKWLLLEKNKVDFRRKEGNLPDAIIICKVPWNVETDAPQGKDVELIGCISTERLIQTAIKLAAGEYIPNTRCRLQANNYAMAFDQLYDVRSSVEWMLENIKGVNYGRIY